MGRLNHLLNVGVVIATLVLIAVIIPIATPITIPATAEGDDSTVKINLGTVTFDVTPYIVRKVQVLSLIHI